MIDLNDLSPEDIKKMADAIIEIAGEENIYLGYGDFKTVPAHDADSAQFLARGVISEVRNAQCVRSNKRQQDFEAGARAYLEDTETCPHFVVHRGVESKCAGGRLVTEVHGITVSIICPVCNGAGRVPKKKL